MSFESFGKQRVFVEENLGKPQQILEFGGVGYSIAIETLSFFLSN